MDFMKGIVASLLVAASFGTALVQRHRERARRKDITPPPTPPPTVPPGPVGRGWGNWG